MDNSEPGSDSFSDHLDSSPVIKTAESAMDGLGAGLGYDRESNRIGNTIFSGIYPNWSGDATLWSR